MGVECIFPAELEREIFETAALMYPWTIPTLLMVARRVLLWVEPLLYRVVRVTDRTVGMTPALLMAMSSKPPDFFYAVRHLGLESTTTPWPGGTKGLLKLCKNATNLCLNVAHTEPTLLPILAEMHVERMSVDLQLLFGADAIDLRHPVVRSLTHLDMFGINGVPALLAEISTLPALTHLCLDADLPRVLPLSVLAACPHLHVLLVQWPSGNYEPYELARFPHVYDMRFVIGTYGHYWVEWEEEARGLTSFWAQADDFVQRKRNGVIAATRYWIY
ncbi:hypothetical protein C8R47DRAFT_600895 [Mycena vitilis]|nr:hypothetical protein C8R47DRAFT_600895 [Mycena vitilis]